MAACGDSPTPETEAVEAGTMTASNILLEDWDTPFAVPPFDQISSEDYLPALRAGMEDQTRKISDLVGNTDAPTFANTIEALERSDDLLDQVNNVFSAVNAAHADDVIRETAKVFAPEQAAHGDNINLNPELFDRVNAVYEQREELGLSGEELRLLEETLKRFVRAGANLDDDSQSRLREINAELATISNCS
jgi:peptidyl-dipeptidase Dcp